MADRNVFNVGRLWRRAKRRAVWAAALAAFAFLTTADDAHASDVEFGRYLATECMTCHRTTAAARKTIPNIYGMKQVTFVTVVKAYRAKERANDVMQAVASRLKDDEIEALAAFFAQAKRP